VDIRYQYDRLGRLTNTIDAAGNAVSIRYDSLGRKLNMTDPVMGAWTYQYDRLSRMTNQTDVKGQRVTFDYSDPLGRLKTKRIYDATNGLVDTITYYYDISDDPAFAVFTGQVYKIAQSSATNRFGYDARGNLLKSEIQVLSFGTYITTSTYDELNRPLTVTYPNEAATLQYNYGSVGNLESISSLSGVGASNVTFYKLDEINELGQATKATYGNGLVTEIAHYPLSRRARTVQTHLPGSGTIHSLDYAYHANGFLRDIVDNIRTGAAAATYRNIQYDDLYRLTSLEHPSPAHGGALQPFAYSYDLMGNIRTNENLGANAAYRYEDARPNLLTSIGYDIFQYDEMGNLTNGMGRTLEYDARNRLVKVTTPDGITALFTYLDSGQRLTKTIVADGQTNTTLYLGDSYEERDGEQLCHVFFGGQRIATFAPEDGSQAANTLGWRFARALGMDDASARWQVTVPSGYAGRWKTYVVRLPADPLGVGYGLYGAAVLALMVLLLWPGAPCGAGRKAREQTGFLRTPLAALILKPRGCEFPRYQRALSLALVVALFIAGLPPAPAHAQMIFPRGDVNGDGIVDITDAMLIQQVVDGIRQIDDSIFNIVGFGNGDVNYDGATNETDARIIAEYVVGLRELPELPLQTCTFFYYTGNHLGSSSIITDKEGNLVRHTEYTPFGELRFDANLGVSVNHLYTGQEFDKEIGLYYYNARYYDAKIGRFIQPDPFIPNPADDQAYNRYAYCRNNPIMLTDPTGYWGVTIGPLTVGSGGAGWDWDYFNPISNPNRGNGVDLQTNLENNQEEIRRATPAEIRPFIAPAIGVAVTSVTGNPIAGGAVAGYFGAYMAGGTRQDMAFATGVGAGAGWILGGLSSETVAVEGWIAGSASGGFTGAAYSARYGGNMWDAAWKGAAAGAAGAYFGQLIDYPGYAGAILAGAVGGISSGAVYAHLTGENLSQGMIRGAIAGAIAGGIAYGLHNQLGPSLSGNTATVYQAKEWFIPWGLPTPIKNLFPVYHRYYILSTSTHGLMQVEFGRADQTSWRNGMYGPGKVYSEGGASIPLDATPVYNINADVAFANALKIQESPPNYAVLNTGALPVSAILNVLPNSTRTRTMNCQSFREALLNGAGP